VDESRALGADSRLTSGPAPALAASAFADELRAAPYLLPWLGVADMAHVAMLTHSGVLEPERGARLLRMLLAMDEKEVEVELDPFVGDLYNNRDLLLRDILGGDAGVVHTARARREATTIAWQLACRVRIVSAGRSLSNAVDALIDVADEHRETIMPDYTYMQAAHPTTLGHYLLGFVYALLRDNGRFVSAFRTVNRSPAGAGSVNGSRFPFDRRSIADLLRFDDVITHTRDAMWAPDMASDQLHAVATTLTNVDRLAEDLQLWATNEFGYVELSDGHARSSVIMPHKKNPYALAWLRGQARLVLGRWVGVVGTFLTPTGQPDNRIAAYVEVPSAMDTAAACLELVSDVVRRAQFNVERMASAASDGYLYASDICDLLVERTGVDNRSAHRIVGFAVRQKIERGGGPLDVEDLAAAAEALSVHLAPVDRNALAQTRAPADLVALRRSIGGAAPEPMLAMIDAVRRSAADVRAMWDKHSLVGFREAFYDDIRQVIREFER
jgi:argininosuccinate lyase